MDGIRFDGETFVVALAIGKDGRKCFSACTRRRSENGDFQRPRLNVLDGAREALLSVQAELERMNPSAAQGLAEGMEETLTIHKLGVP